ncbi:peptidase [Erwinia pyri]|uniref:Peptidase n=1 Tax=Erwinia pyri TaxID=3062598 RepID=A0AA50DFK7_9GAMM|nr:peptidase [Erwinia sp. DE2]WLS77366.1 peptidase [Erwinia sp. DE2]
MKLNVISRQTNALLLLFPLMLLTGCATQQNPQVEYRAVKQPQLSLPAELTSQIDVPPVPDDLTFGDSVSLNAELYGLLGQCNIDRAGISKIEEKKGGASRAPSKGASGTLNPLNI